MNTTKIGNGMNKTHCTKNSHCRSFFVRCLLPMVDTKWTSFLKILYKIDQLAATTDHCHIRPFDHCYKLYELSYIRRP